MDDIYKEVEKVTDFENEDPTAALRGFFEEYEVEVPNEIDEITPEHLEEAADYKFDEPEPFLETVQTEPEENEEQVRCSRCFELKPVSQTTRINKFEEDKIVGMSFVCTKNCLK